MASQRKGKICGSPQHTCQQASLFSAAKEAAGIRQDTQLQHQHLSFGDSTGRAIQSDEGTRLKKKKKHFGNITYTQNKPTSPCWISLCGCLSSRPEAEATPPEQHTAEETVIIDQDAATTETPGPSPPNPIAPRFQFNTGLDQISLAAELRYIFDTSTLEAQPSTD